MGERKAVHSGTLEERPSGREVRNSRLARKLAAEGMVLLKNDGMLPLKASISVALFGSGASQTVKGGTGSGDVNNRESCSVYKGLKEAGVQIASEGWLADYGKEYEDARKVWKEKILEDAKRVENPFDAYAMNPFFLPGGRSIQKEDMAGASAAIYVISRRSGEGKDRSRTEGDYYLSKTEWEHILYLNQQNIPIALILNVGAPIELTDILQEAGNIKAVLHTSLPGQEGGRAIADVLLGKSVPDGRLTATWAKRYGDYPFAEAFGALNGDLEKEEYREGIYVGYRYFGTFGVQPLFPFGYGLSYTDFSVSFENLELTELGFDVTVTVKNIGASYAGREVVQVYAALPQAGAAQSQGNGVHHPSGEGKVPPADTSILGTKESHRLVGFAKTGLLQPGETQRLTIAVGQKQLASFSEEKMAWVVEDGTYGICLGKHAESLQLAATLTVPEPTVLEQVEEISPKQAEFEELDGTGAVRRNVLEDLREGQEVPSYSFQPEKGASMAEGKQALKASMEGQDALQAPIAGKEGEDIPSIAEELPVEELIPLLYGNITQGASTLGSSGIRVPGSAGETTEALEGKYGICSLIMADGPAGLRLRRSYQADRASGSVYGAGVLGSLENGFLEEMEYHEDADTYYQYCTAFPVGTALAQTWDTGLMQEFGRAIAEEMREFHVDLWLAPGMNIQRNPLCGRNFEYYSEDPYLSGMMAAAVTSGVQEDGDCGVTVKHFACNNQEDNRMGVDACVSQRALREIYLRGFEIAVKQGAPAAVMTSYNQINGVHAANLKGLCTTVLRREWGFEGVVMSDWNTTVPEDGSSPWKCVAAGNDIIMPGNPEDDADIRRAYREGELSGEEIRACAGRVIALADRLERV